MPGDDRGCGRCGTAALPRLANRRDRNREDRTEKQRRNGDLGEGGDGLGNCAVERGGSGSVPRRAAVDDDDEHPEHDGAAAEQEREAAPAERAEAREHEHREHPADRRGRLERLPADKVRAEQPGVEDDERRKSDPAERTEGRRGMVRGRGGRAQGGSTCAGHGLSLWRQPPETRQPAGTVQNLSMIRTKRSTRRISAIFPAIGGRSEGVRRSREVRVTFQVSTTGGVGVQV